MKPWTKLVTLSLSLIALIISAPLALAQDNTVLQNTSLSASNGPSNSPPVIIPPAPDLNASSYVLMDVNSGAILAEKNMDQRLQPASLTKLVTLYITFEALANGQASLNSQARVSRLAWSTGGSRMFLKLGSDVPISDLIQGIIVASGNDATVALAEYIGGTVDSFVSLMNATAQRLGMTNSHFQDPDGLPMPQHYTTAHDLAILARNIITNFPQYYSFFKQKWIVWNGIRQPNRNRLLWRDAYVDGLKTGHTEEAGYCLIASGVKHGMRLLTVVMGASSDSERFDDSQALLNWGFRFYNTRQLFRSSQVVAKRRVWFGQTKTMKFGIAKNIYITTPVGQYRNIQAALTLPSIIEAPIIKGKTYGKIIIQLAGKTIGEEPVVALNNDAKAGLWSRVSDRIALFFHKVV